MSQEFTSRDDAGGPQVLEVYRLYGALSVVKIALRKRINNLDQSIEERRQLYQDLKAQEATLEEEIAQQLAQLDPDDAWRIRERYQGDAA